MKLHGFERELEVVHELLMEGGKILLDNYNKPRGVERKVDGTFVTDVDREISGLMRSVLTKEFPGYGHIDEEQTNSLNADMCWVTDPLDDTKGYIDKTDTFGIITALRYKTRTVFAATYKPLSGEFVYAAEGCGAYMEGKDDRLKVSDADGIHMLVSRTRRIEGFERVLEAINPDKIEYMGGSLKTVKVAKGEATAFLCPRSRTMHIWDIEGPALILREAGGNLYNLNKQEPSYGLDFTNHGGLLVTNGRVDKIIFERISRLTCRQVF